MAKADFDKSKFDCKKGDYCVGKAVDLADPSLQARAQEYRRQISAKMRPLSGEDAYKIPKSKGYYVTRKYDGEFAMLVWDGTTLISVSPSGTVRVGLPCYDEAEMLLKKAKVKECVLAGELYVMTEVTRAHPVQQVVRVLRSPKSVTELDKIGVAIFDVIEIDSKSPATTKATFDALKKIFGKGDRAHVSEFRIADKPDTILEAFAEWVIGDGAEGIVVRHDRAGWYKVKSRHNIDVAIIGYSESQDEARKGMLHDLLVAVVREDGTFHELTRVGGGFTEEERKSIADEMRRRVVSSDYVAVNNDYVAYEMVHPGPVIEISCLDLIPESARGGPVNKMVLDFDGKRFNALSRMPLVSVISPQFVRYRDDKEANVEDTNIRQIADLVAIADTEKPARDTDLSPSKLLERTVYTKTMRGNQMVRKLLLWKTNKDDQIDFPGYVVYLTDFSPNRQNPLERDIRIAQNEKAARQMFQELAEKNFVGGWEKIA